MGKAALVGGLLLLTVLAFAALTVPAADCPECGVVEACLRCEERRRLTLFDRAFRPESHPELVGWSRGERVELPGGFTPLDYGPPHRGYDRWQSLRAGRSQLMVVADWTETTTEDGSPCRVLLFHRTGEQLDFMEIRLKDSPELLAQVDPVAVAVRLTVGDRDPRPAAYLVRRRDGPAVEVPLAAWPPDWPATGIGRIVVREGRLALVPP